MSETFDTHHCTQPSFLPGMVPGARQCLAKVVAVRPLARDTRAVRLHAPEVASQITPGQFLMVRPSAGSDPLLGRPFALFDIFRDSSGTPVDIEFGFVVVGKMTTLMSHWQPGDSVQIWGPLGNGFPVPECDHLICVAGGIGQTPFLGVIREAAGQETYGSPSRSITHRPQTVELCYGVRSAEYVAGEREFTDTGVPFRLATDDGSRGYHGFVTELLKQSLAERRPHTRVYCCGPEPMMKAVAEICETAEVPCWLSLETPMACGFGACFSCVTKVREPDGTWDYRRTCVEGPVFPADRLVL